MKKNIAILAGGNSSEFPVSMNSARTIKDSLDTNRYNIYLVVIKGNSWTLQFNGQSIEIDKNDFSCKINNKTIKFDCAFIIIHGTPGENGLLQGYFETLHIPYTTCGVLSSSLTFNKIFSKRYITKFNIPVSKYHIIEKNQSYNADIIIEDIGLPCFVKPNRAGSSFGITKVTQKEEFDRAVNKAFEEDNQVLAEEFLEGTELTCGLIKTKEEELIFPSTEIVPKNEFFDYEAKYTKGMADEITPSRIPESLEAEVKALSSRIYDLFDCRGIVRIDYIYSHEQLYFMEVNTIPGMSAASIVPQQIEAMGKTLTEVFTLAIEDAMSDNTKEGLEH
ncbi:MAG: D-alanine--D-alanine ligase [Bacteroidales bacterium]